MYFCIVFDGTCCDVGVSDEVASSADGTQIPYEDREVLVARIDRIYVRPVKPLNDCGRRGRGH